MHAFIEENLKYFIPSKDVQDAMHEAEASDGWSPSERDIVMMIVHENKSYSDKVSDLRTCENLNVIQSVDLRERINMFANAKVYEYDSDKYDDMIYALRNRWYVNIPHAPRYERGDIIRYVGHGYPRIDHAIAVIVEEDIRSDPYINLNDSCHTFDSLELPVTVVYPDSDVEQMHIQYHCIEKVDDTAQYFDEMYINDEYTRYLYMLISGIHRVYMLDYSISSLFGTYDKLKSINRDHLAGRQNRLIVSGKEFCDYEYYAWYK